MWTDAHAAVLAAFAAAFGLPPGDDAARAWTRRLAEQFAFSFPSEGWGHKSAGNGRPPSTDVIALRSPFIGFDVILNQGRPDQALDTSPRPIQLAGQEFILVTPTNHLAGQAPGPTPQPTPSPVPTPAPSCRFVALDLEAVRTIVRDEVAAAVRSIGTGVDVVAGELAAERARAEDRYAEIHRIIGEQVSGLLTAIAERAR